MSDKHPFLETEAIMKRLGNTIDGELKRQAPGFGFALLVFHHNQPGIGNYISNTNRADMIKALRETAARLENREDIPPATGEA